MERRLNRLIRLSTGESLQFGGGYFPQSRAGAETCAALLAEVEARAVGGTVAKGHDEVAAASGPALRGRGQEGVAVARGVVRERSRGRAGAIQGAARDPPR